MATIIESTNDLEKQYLSAKRNARIWTFVLILSFVLLFPTTGLSIPFFILSVFMSDKYHKKKVISEKGLKGEEKTTEIFRSLPDTYTVLQNVKVEFENKVSELDHIVVGPNGIFVVETKNLNGYIEGNIEKREWIQHKIGRKGGEYSKTFYNPVKQVGTHVYRLSSYLKQNGIYTWVQGAVYFSNPEADVVFYNYSDAIPVFQASDGGTKELERYIYEYKKKPLTVDTNKKIVSILKKIA